ncbi:MULTISPECIES: hypothetical protein [unclassified Paenibacillus]|uniref:hypothetical protein n=1 Tax=unclassified Paenibacillus TaxID=185978 RepID=UPI0009A79DB5|nr:MULTISPECIES: hypothetical protein [unclassified Paenibacillus]SLK21724.1 hypothetical protein SAMN06272722_11966 [Paenibacillus sp. RU5A]SOC76716.1 hypothetical protein SAMN05880581_11966 [Paenibacillus sp. RU26A]SOC78107.1 hypothetical protein SAMN05880586_11966 [Paenibacillus sp. RU5M]
MNKPFYKKWWFWVIAVILFGAIGSFMEEPTDETLATTPVAETETVDPIKEPEKTPEPTKELTPQEKIADNVEKSTTKMRKVSIKDFQVNENFGTEKDGDYIVLAYMSFDAENTAETTRTTIENYNNEIAANLAVEENVQDLVIFWEVPYLQSGSNVIKATLFRKDGKMVFDNTWYEPSVF